jgi:hypothetical protein
MFEPSEDLSPAGIARREAILNTTLRAVRRRRRARRAAVGAIGATAALLVFLLWPGRLPTVQPADPGRIVAPPRLAEWHVEIVPLDTTVTDRLTVHDTPQTWTILGDDELIGVLAAAGQQAGLIRLNGETMLVTDGL